MKHITTKEFKENIFDFTNDSNLISKNDLPIVLYCSAQWCGPCKILSPIMDEISNDFDGKVDVYKIDVDEEHELASLFNIRSIPTLIFVKDKVIDKIIGAVPKSKISITIEQSLLK